MSVSPEYWARRAALQSRSDELRRQLVVHGQAVAPLFGVAEQARQVSRFLKKQPWIPLIALGVIFLKRPRRWLRWSWKGYTAWKGLMKWRRIWKGAGSS